LYKPCTTASTLAVSIPSGSGTIEHKGKAATLIKGSAARKRTRAELEEFKEEEHQLKGNRKDFLR
jgi:hypothetical protein